LQDASGEAAVSRHWTLLGSRRRLERPARGGESPVGESWQRVDVVLSTTGHEEPCGKLGGPPSKANYSERPIVDQYREGKVKSTPGGE
jgi:hypothetical protein